MTLLLTFGIALQTLALSVRAGSDNSLEMVSEVFDSPVSQSDTTIKMYLGRALADGGLYLVDAKNNRAILRINKSWWFDSLEQFIIKNLDDDRDNEILILANYYTGIGPTGAETFQNKAILDYHNGQWQRRPVTVDGDQNFQEQPQDKTPHQIYIVENQKQLQIVGALTPEFDASKIDFNHHRIATARILLASGSMQIKDIRVFQNDKHYFINYQVDTPDVGSADIKIVTLYAILPRDHRAVTISSSQAPISSVRLHTIETGVL